MDGETMSIVTNYSKAKELMDFRMNEITHIIMDIGYRIAYDGLLPHYNDGWKHFSEEWVDNPHYNPSLSPDEHDEPDNCLKFTRWKQISNKKDMVHLTIIGRENDPKPDFWSINIPSEIIDERNDYKTRKWLETEFERICSMKRQNKNRLQYIKLFDLNPKLVKKILEAIKDDEPITWAEKQAIMEKAGI